MQKDKRLNALCWRSSMRFSQSHVWTNSQLASQSNMQRARLNRQSIQQSIRVSKQTVNTSCGQELLHGKNVESPFFRNYKGIRKRTQTKNFHTSETSTKSFYEVTVEGSYTIETLKNLWKLTKDSSLSTALSRKKLRT